MSLIVLSLIATAASGVTATSGALQPVPPASLIEPPAIVRHQLEEGASKRAAYLSARKPGAAELKSWASENGPVLYDVRHYDLDLHVDVSEQVLSGTVVMDVEAVEDGLGIVELDADLGLRILSVLQLGDEAYPYDSPRKLGFAHDDNRLSITLARALATGEAVRLQITYGGHASRIGLIGSTGVNWFSNAGTPVIHTFAQPFGARVWWPCNDRPDDKATVTMRMTVPEGLDIASNGLERSRVDNGDGTSTSVWSSIYEVPTYLVVMHISDFVYTEDTYTALDGTTMPVSLWAMPDVAAQAEADLAVTVPQIEVMADHWGEYPFLEEKYGNATVFFGGGMEHQTMTTLSVFAVGDPWMQWLNVHELGHQWWGDWVTMDDWRHIWLNEGYATHTEWLWAEHLGPEVLAQYLIDEDYLGQFMGSVYDNPEPFSWTIYAKGSWVAWMLRHVIGDDAFFDAMASYRAANAEGTATTDELQAAMEVAGEIDLDWFFDQWVYNPNRPRYLWSWEAVAGPAISLNVTQTQTNAGLFRMPMNVRVTTTAGTEDHTVWFEAEADQTIEIPLSAEATAVVLNPDTHVLCEIAHVSEPDLELGPDFPDGFDAGVVSAGAPATLTIPLTNTGGVDLVIDLIGSANPGVSDLIDPPDFPLTIAPGETHEINVSFRGAGTGYEDAWYGIFSNDPDREGEAFFRVSGVTALYPTGFLAAPNSTSVGRVPLGGTGEASFDALNIGAEPLAVSTTVEGEGFFLAKTVPSVFAPGSSNEVIVRFNPTSVGETSGAVIFHAGDPNDPIKTVTVAATGEGAPRLELDPATVSLGIGDASTTATLAIGNSGTEDLVVSVLAPASPFTVTEPDAGSMVIASGSSQLVEIGLDGAADGGHSGHLAIHSNDPAVPVALVPIQAFVTDQPSAAASFPAVARGPGLGDAFWSTTAFLLNPSDGSLQTDIVFRPPSERSSSGADAGFSVPARSQRVIHDVVGAAGANGTGGLNLRSGGTGLVAVSRTFASDSGGTYGQFIAASSHDDALSSDARYLLAGLAGNDGFHTNIGVLNLADETLHVDYWFFGSSGELVGTTNLTAKPGAFAQSVAVISKLTDAVIRGGYATMTTTDENASYLAYASVVDDSSHDPTLVVPQDLATDTDGVDLVVPIVASNPGIGGTNWLSELTMVNTTAESRTVTIEYNPVSGTSVTSMPMEVAAGATLHFDDVVGGLFGTTGKGWLRVSASGAGVFCAGRAYNDDVAGTYGQLIPAIWADEADGPGAPVILAGLNSSGGFRTNLGITSMASAATVFTFEAFDGSGTSLGTVDIDVPASAVVQVEEILSGSMGFEGFAWARVSSDDPAASFFVHASVIDGSTGDPTYVPAINWGE